MEENDLTSWAQRQCTLPLDELPSRLAEFDELFTTALRRQHRSAPRRLRWELDPEAQRRARDLTARETECCPFFVFTFTSVSGVLWLDVEVPPDHIALLDALEARAAAVPQIPA